MLILSRIFPFSFFLDRITFYGIMIKRRLILYQEWVQVSSSLNFAKLLPPLVSMEKIWKSLCALSVPQKEKFFCCMCALILFQHVMPWLTARSSLVENVCYVIMSQNLVSTLFVIVREVNRSEAFGLLVFVFLTYTTLMFPLSFAGLGTFGTSWTLESFRSLLMLIGIDTTF